MARSEALEKLLREQREKKRKYYSEVGLEDLDAAMKGIGDINTSLDDGDDETLSPSPSTPTPDDTSLNMDLNISDDLNSLSVNSSTDSKEMDFEDIGEIPDLDTSDIEGLSNDDTTTATDDIAAMPDDDLDGMINSIGGDETDGAQDTDMTVSDQEDGPDDDIGIDDEDTVTNEQAVDTLSPEDELKRRKQCINIIKKIYETYRDKVNRFNELQLPYDKERIYKPIFDKYTKVFNLLGDYVLDGMKKDESFKLMRRIVDFNTLFTILDHRLKMVNDWIQQMQK